MRRVKHFSCLFSLMIALFLCIGQAMAEFGVCYIPGDSGKKDVLFTWGYGIDKFAFLDMYTGKSGKYTKSEELKEIASRSFKDSKYIISWGDGETKPRSYLSIINSIDGPKSFENNLVEFTTSDGVHYWSNAMCAMSLENNMNDLLAKLHKWYRGTDKIPSKL
jgi:hypothetical protein